MVPASGLSTHLHRTLSGPNSPSHMPTQAVANPPKLVGPKRRPSGCGKVRIRCTICVNTRCTFAFAVVAMISGLVGKHEARPPPPHNQLNHCSMQPVLHCVWGTTGRPTDRPTDLDASIRSQTQPKRRGTELISSTQFRRLP